MKIKGIYFNLYDWNILRIDKISLYLEHSLLFKTECFIVIR
jgi:hypothetical protein